jgi:lambda repressor-like predicted transcriptional regulator
MKAKPNRQKRPPKSKFDTSWRPRLQEAFDAVHKKTGLSETKVSKKAGCGHGYLNEVLKAKEPTVGRLMAICEVLDVSVMWILLAIDMTAKQEQALKGYLNLPYVQGDAMLEFVAQKIDERQKSSRSRQ